MLSPTRKKETTLITSNRGFDTSIVQMTEKLRRIQGLTTTGSHYTFKQAWGRRRYCQGWFGGRLVQQELEPGRKHSCCRGGCLRQKKRGNTLASPFFPLSRTPTVPPMGRSRQEASWHRSLGNSLQELAEMWSREGKGQGVAGMANRFRTIACPVGFMPK